MMTNIPIKTRQSELKTRQSGFLKIFPNALVDEDDGVFVLTLASLIKALDAQMEKAAATAAANTGLQR